MKKRIPMPIVLVAVIMIATGCANYDLVENAKESYDQVKDDPNITAQAPNAIQEAEKQFRIIDNLKKNGAGRQLINHHAYIAQQKVAIARETATLNKRQDELAELEKQHQVMLAEVQQAEERVARQRVEKARLEAEEARRKSEMLANRLNELEAEKTERGMVINLQKVLFDFGKATIKPGAEVHLDKLSQFLLEYPERKVLIEGFTDNVGPESVNQQLSEARAEAVKQVMVAKGVAPDRIMTRGYGEAFAIADNSTQAGRQQNRRVEVVISDGNGTISARRPPIQ